MSMLKRPLSAFVLGACLFALSACDSKDDPTPDAGMTVDAGTGSEPDAGTDAGSTEEPPPVIPEGHTLLTPSATEVHSVPRGGLEAPLRFAFVAQAGHHYDFIVEAGMEGYVLDLRDAQGKAMDHVDQRFSGIDPFERSWHWSGLKVGKVHTVAVSQVTVPTQLPFRFRFVDMGLDDYGDLLTTAQSWTPSEQPLTGTGEHAGERDLFSVETVQGHVYLLDGVFPSQSWELGFIDSLQELHASVDGLGFRETQGATAFKSPGGVMYASIRSNPLDSPPQPYTVVLKDLGAEDHGDSVETATVLPPGTTSVEARMEVVTDKDLFSLGVVAGHFYRVSCTIDGDKSCRLRNAAPGSDFSYLQGGDMSTTAFRASQATHFVHVDLDPVVPARWVVGHYTLQFEDLGPDDHGDTLATATPLTGPSQAVSVFIGDTSDHDVLSFDATAGQRYQFACEWKEHPSQIQLNAAFMDAQGGRYPGDLARVGPRWVRTFTAPTSGTYGIDLWTSSTVALGASACWFDVLAP